jgi:hypothetical protein
MDQVEPDQEDAVVEQPTLRERSERLRAGTRSIIVNRTRRDEASGAVFFPGVL